MSESQPFFQNDGNLHVIIPSKEARWIDFLIYSRLLNSPKGGWDFKSTWKVDGLERLADAEFIERWTDNSLRAQKTYPRPRTSEFKFARDFTVERRNAADSCATKPIGGCSENSLNARLFQNHGVFSSRGAMTCGTNPFTGPLLGYEVPLCDDSDGQFKIDLLACDQIARRLEIIELKQASNTNNSPLMALVEGICYGLQLWRCSKELSRESRDTAKRLNDPRFELAPEHFNVMQIIIAAPSQYWDYWDCPNGGDEVVKDRMDEILKAVSLETQRRGFTLTLGKFCHIKSEHVVAASNPSSPE